MTDIHSHLLNDLDDGACSLNDSVELLKKMAQLGFKDVLLTPHYIWSSQYAANNESKLKKFNALKSEINRLNVNIRIHLGNEIFIAENIVDLINAKEVASLNGTKYVLIELPLYNENKNFEDLLLDVKYAGFIPVVAHPERYDYFNDFSRIQNMHDEGIMFQANYGSIIGLYGKEVKKRVKKLFKLKLIDFLGTDIHKPNSDLIILNFKKMQKKIIKLTGEKYYQKIVDNCNTLIK